MYIKALRAIVEAGKAELLNDGLWTGEDGLTLPSSVTGKSIWTLIRKGYLKQLNSNVFVPTENGILYFEINGYGKKISSL